VAALHYRALGATIGRRAVVPVFTLHEPDLLKVANDTQIGSGLCAEFGVVLEPFSTITNSCVVDAGCRLGVGALLVSARQYSTVQFS